MDRRTKRTRALLGKALIDLMQTRSLSDISIRSITDQADVAYSTFFRNFESKEALLLHVMHQVIENLKGDLRTAGSRTLAQEVRISMLSLFRSIQADEATHRVLVQAPSAAPILKEFKQELIGSNLRLFEHMGVKGRSDAPPIPLIIENGMTQLFGLIDWWLDQDRKPSPEVMVDYYMALVIRPSWTLILGEEQMQALLGE